MIRAVSAVLDFAPDHWTPAVRIVALALADRVNHEHQCWPSIADVCRRTGLSERSVQMHLRQLEREGVVDRVGQRSNGCGQPVSNLWIWRHWPDGGVQWAAPGGVQPTAPPSRGGGVQPTAPKPSSLNHKREPSP